MKFSLMLSGFFQIFAQNNSMFNVQNLRPGKKWMIYSVRIPIHLTFTPLISVSPR